MLRYAGAIDATTKVSSFEASSIGTGQVGANVRFALTYDRTGPPAPATVTTTRLWFDVIVIGWLGPGWRTGLSAMTPSSVVRWLSERCSQPLQVATAKIIPLVGGCRA